MVKCAGLGELQREENGQKLLLEARKMYRKHLFLQKGGLETGRKDGFGFYESMFPLEFP